MEGLETADGMATGRKEEVNQLILVEFSDVPLKISEQNNIGVTEEDRISMSLAARVDDKKNFNEDMQTPHLRLVQSLRLDGDVKDCSEAEEPCGRDDGEGTGLRQEGESEPGGTGSPGIHKDAEDEEMFVNTNVHEVITDVLSTIEQIEESNKDLEQSLFQDQEKEKVNCCNCNCVLTLEGESAVKLDETFSCKVYQFSCKTSETCKVKVVDALDEVFKIEQNCKEKYQVLRTKRNLLMCSNCVGTLCKLYQCYHEFISLSFMTNSVLEEITRLSDKGKKELDLSKHESTELSTKTQVNHKFARVLRSSEGNSVIKLEAEPKALAIRSKESKTVFKIKNKKDRKIVPPRGKGLIQLSVSKYPESLSDPKKSKRIIEFKSEVKPEDSTGKRNRNEKGQAKNDNQEYEIENNDYYHHSGDTIEDGDKKCDRCGKTFKSSGGLKIHYASHVRDDNKYSCKECGKRFWKLEAMKMHEKTDHGGFKPHKCPHQSCGRNFRLRDKLRLHIKVVHEKKMPFPCPKCEKSFRTKYHLKIHDVAQHVHGDNSIGCSQCKRKFNSREALETHLKVHEEEKPFVCIKCHKGFHTSARLKLHAKSHEVVPSCLCPVCGKAYKHIRDLRLHEAVHQDESTYRFGCGDCPKKFYRIDLLRVHQSNEKHFAPEIVGPSISKVVDTVEKSHKKGVSKTQVTVDNESEDELALFDQINEMSPKRRKSNKPKCVKKELTSLSHNPLRCPTMVKLQMEEPLVDELGLDDTGLPTLQTSTNLFSQKFIQDLPGTASLVTSVKDCSANLPTQTVTNTGTITFSQHHPSPLQIGTNTIYTLRDPSDRSLSAFSISAGAEQIGFDVINAFINNLN